MHEEALAANREAIAAHPLDYEANFSLSISGQVGKPATLSHDELVKLATTTVTTHNIQDPERTTPTEFRGVLVRDLVDRFQASPAATEITFVCADAFRATVDVADVRANRMLLAIEADGSPIAPDDGGPVFLIHPVDEASPAYRAKYTDRFWGFYVTDMVVGTEEPHLTVGGKTFDRDALAQLRESSLDVVAGWKVDWPASPVKLRGVRLADVLAAAGVALPPHGHVIVRGKAPIHHDKAKPAGIDVDDLDRCPPLLALAYGEDGKPIPARLGGPIAMAMAPCDARYDGAPDFHWITMVESIDVVPP